MKTRCPRCHGDAFVPAVDGGGTRCAGCSLDWTPMLTAEQAAEFARVSLRTVSRWIKAGALVAIPEGKTKLIRLDQVMKVNAARGRTRLPRNTLSDPTA